MLGHCQEQKFVPGATFSLSRPNSKPLITIMNITKATTAKRKDKNLQTVHWPIPMITTISLIISHGFGTQSPPYAIVLSNIIAISSQEVYYGDTLLKP